ncbi:MAG: molybdate ABC transporter substrate-binding protein [Geothrix sp.]|nr:molybdate ABC transporter substrate-binding protein [Geothrix sp.]
MGRRFRHLLRLLLVPLSALALQAQTLNIAAAANLKAALDVLGPAFEAGHPGVRLQVSLGASGSLVAQIQQGAPFDVFLAADAEFPARLAAAGLAAGPSFPYATGRLVLWVRRDLRLDPGRDGFRVLLDPAVKRVAVGHPVLAPFGRSAAAALRAAGLEEALKAKLVFGENIAQAAQFLQAGAAEAGFISSSQALAPALAGGLVWVVPQAFYPVQKQCGVLLKRSPQPALAAAFQAYLLGPGAQAQLARLGYGAP